MSGVLQSPAFAYCCNSEWLMYLHHHMLQADPLGVPQLGGRIGVLVLRWARSQQVTNRQEHKRVLNLSVISQSEHQTYIVIIEENIEVRQYTRQDTLRSSDV